MTKQTEWAGLSEYEFQLMEKIDKHLSKAFWFGLFIGVLSGSLITHIIITLAGGA